MSGHPRPREPAWHHRERRQRFDAKALLRAVSGKNLDKVWPRIEKAQGLLRHHHGSAPPLMAGSQADAYNDWWWNSGGGYGGAAGGAKRANKHKPRSRDNGPVEIVVCEVCPYGKSWAPIKRNLRSCRVCSSLFDYGSSVVKNSQEHWDLCGWTGFAASESARRPGFRGHRRRH